MTDRAVHRLPIRRLSRETVERIAAGEVVERPASVVKELVENAMDAGATVVSVRLQGGGLTGIEVADNGFGIPPDELELAVERHATSKLAPDGPIETIDALGFRGEALAAIASVSRFHLLSRTPDREVADGVSVVGGRVAGRYSAPRAPGTTVEVEELFFNTPARRKFLKSAVAEQLEVVRTVERLYVARPSVTVRLEAEGREIATLPAATRVEDAAARVLGPGLLRTGFPVAGPLPTGRVRGILGHPASAASSSAGLYLAVNGRSVSSRAIAQAVRAAYADHLPRGRFPIGVVHLELDPATVDVNVHPTKREVRFARERELLDALRIRVREALLAAPQVAELAARGGPEAAAVDPSHTPSEGEPWPTGAAAGLQSTLDGDVRPSPAVAVPAATGHPALTLLGCYRSLFWIAESDEGLVLIDQHAASERVLYESVLKDGRLARQELVAPVTLRLSAAQREALAARGEEVLASGFEVEAFGPETFRVRSVPAFQGRRARPEALLGLLDELAAGGRATVSDGLRERTAATIACHAAIRAGDPVAPEEFRKVLRALYGLPGSSYSCPHGRPILVQFPRARLDRWFLRTGA